MKLSKDWSNVWRNRQYTMEVSEVTIKEVWLFTNLSELIDVLEKEENK